MKIAVVGASGLVGRNILKLLDERNEMHEIYCYTSEKSAGKMINGHTMILLSEENIKAVDFAFFSAGGNVSKVWAKAFIKKGAVIIDNSNAFRRGTSVPLVVPEININEIKMGTKLIANPNCSTIQIALPLYVLNKINPIKRVVVSTYQSASGAGKRGLDDLDNQTTNKFSTVLQDDLIPQIDIPLENGFTLEEDKIRFELKKILSLPKLKVNATAVRVPIHYCHGASVYIECENEVNINEFLSALNYTKGIKVLNDLKNGVYPLTKIAKNTDNVYVGRIRKDLDNKKALSFWVVADNLRKGAATNAVQIMNEIIKKEKNND